MSDFVTLGNRQIPLDWPVKGELFAHFRYRFESGFFQRFLSGDVVLDIGYKGYEPDAVPVFPHAIGYDFDTPGYDGLHLPHDAGTVDTVFTSHTLEHIADYVGAIQEWFRVLKTGGYLVIIVPHQFMFERKHRPPSVWNADHKRFYTPGTLMREIEEALTPNSYRLRHLIDADRGNDLAAKPPHIPPGGGTYDIELAIEKVQPPAWEFL